MASEIKIAIRKKTKVPTKEQDVHLYRSDWIKKYTIEYSESRQFFKHLNGRFEIDSQFCKWMYEQFGEGIYSCIAWKKGFKGFWNFLKVELKEEGFRRLPKSLTKEEKELKEEMKEYKQAKKRFDYDEIETSQMVQDDIKKDIKKTKQGCSPWLKTKHPIYAWHSYDYFQEIDDEEEIKVRGIGW